MSNVIPVADWYEKACASIVREGKTLFQWSNEHNKGLTSRECENVSRTKEFMAVMRAERNKFYKELASDPTRSRGTAVGQLLFSVQKLIEAEQYDKAVAALAQLFKVEGWTSETANVNIFNDINAKGIEEIRRKLQGKTESLPN